MPAHRPPPRDAREHERWIVAELDARGEIDAHAALCLHNALDATGAGATVWVDLRDLLALGAALAVLAQESADCRVRGFELAVLLSGHALHDPIAELLAEAGLRFARSAAGDGDGDGARGEPHAAAPVRSGRAVPHAA